MWELQKGCFSQNYGFKENINYGKTVEIKRDAEISVRNTDKYFSACKLEPEIPLKLHAYKPNHIPIENTESNKFLTELKTNTRPQRCFFEVD